MAGITYRYSFPIQSKIKVGKMTKFPCVIAYLPDSGGDTEAIQFKNTLVDMLENEAKVGINKCVLPVPNEELPTGFVPKDVEDIKVMARWLGPAGEKSEIQNVTFPGMKADVTQESIKVLVGKMYGVNPGTEDSWPLNSVMSISKTLQNVAAGGPIGETVDPRTKP